MEHPGLRETGAGVVAHAMNGRRGGILLELRLPEVPVPPVAVDDRMIHRTDNDAVPLIAVDDRVIHRTDKDEKSLKMLDAVCSTTMSDYMKQNWTRNRLRWPRTRLRDCGR